MQNSGSIVFEFHFELFQLFLDFLRSQTFILLEFFFVLGHKLMLAQPQRLPEVENQLEEPLRFYLLAFVFGGELDPVVPEILLEQGEYAQGVIFSNIIRLELIQHDQNKQFHEHFLAQEDVSDPKYDIGCLNTFSPLRTGYVSRND